MAALASPTAPDLAGLYPPIPTPFKPNGDVDHESLLLNLKKWSAQADFRGYVVQGSNGEYVFLDEDERVAVIATARKGIPAGKLLVAGAGMDGTRSTIKMVKRMAAAGADVALVLTPAYFKGAMLKPAAQIAHFTAVADASPIPVMVYNMPANTGIDLGAGTLLALARHPNIIGLKDSGGNVAKMGQLMNDAPADFQLLAGSASFLLPAMAVGAVGGVCALANIAGPQCLELIKLANAGELEKARALQLTLCEPNAAVTKMFGVPGLKWALNKLGFTGGRVRLPLQDISAENAVELERILKKAGIL